MLILNNDFEKMFNKIFNINIMKVTCKYERLAKKNYICEKCGKEIHKNEYYYTWKPLPKYNYLDKTKNYFKWRKRCIECEPIRENEVDLYEEKSLIYQY